MFFDSFIRLLVSLKAVIIKIGPQIHKKIKFIIKQGKLKDQGIRNISEFYENSLRFMLRLINSENDYS